MSYHYVGSELELFAGATNWKTYFGSVLRRFVVGRVLEVGAGIGSNIPYLHNDLVTEWTALEPDADLAIRIEERLAKGELPANCRLINGKVASVDSEALFDTILYIDVLEHILDDGAELVRSCGHLATGGNLVVLSPAHQFLFTPFDAAIGHHRRYHRAHPGLGIGAPDGLESVARWGREFDEQVVTGGATLKQHLHGADERCQVLHFRRRIACGPGPRVEQQLKCPAVPCALAEIAVTVGVRIDEARNHQPVLRVDDLGVLMGETAPRLNGGDALALDENISILESGHGVT